MSRWVSLTHADLFDYLPTLDADSIDSCVVDPPYGIGFMGREWDTFRAGVEQKRRVASRVSESDNPNLRGRQRAPASSPSAVEYDRSLHGQITFQDWTEAWARQVLRVLKPGAHLVVCGAPRSQHRMVCGIENAGFEIRDMLMWVFGQGFPKSKNLHDEWEGWGTALKPGWEPIVLARKPLGEKTLQANVERWGVGVLNIDGCRIEGETPSVDRRRHAAPGLSVGSTGWVTPARPASYSQQRTGEQLGRWPANVLHDGSEEVLSAFPNTKSGKPVGVRNTEGGYAGRFGSIPVTGFGDEGSASRFFYCAKTSKQDREDGCEALPIKSAGAVTGGRTEGSAGLNSPRAGAGRTTGARNSHPTVKPTALMQWLVRLVTPKGGVVLDCFMGSGSTGRAAVLEQCAFLGVEREAEFVSIAKARIAAAKAKAAVR